MRGGIPRPLAVAAWLSGRALGGDGEAHAPLFSRTGEGGPEGRIEWAGAGQSATERWRSPRRGLTPHPCPSTRREREARSVLSQFNPTAPNPSPLHLQRRDERLLRDLDPPELTHALL